MKTDKHICVFGASAKDLPEDMISSVTALCKKLGEADFSLVFGGFGGGLMGASAKGFAAAGQEIIGVVPATLTGPRQAHPACTQVIETPNLDERKRVMEAQSDAFLIVPGGIGTMDELFGVLAKRVAGESRQPVVLYNYKGFYDTLHGWLRQLDQSGFMIRRPEELYLVSDDPEEICRYLQTSCQG